MNPNNQITEIILGQEQKLEIDPRYFLQTAERAMKSDVVRGLVELLTNADDSYGELESNGVTTNGQIIISVQRRRQGKGAIFVIKDKAEGMRLEEMVNKLKRVGGITSKFIENKGMKTRGLMGRGSKECVIFGSITFKSIKDGIYSELEIKKPAHFVPIKEKPASEYDRIDLDIPKGNGTVVTLEVEPQFRIPAHQFLQDNLPKYYSLRDIFASNQRNVYLVDLGNTNGRKDHLTYSPKIGDIQIDETFIVPGYPKAEAHIQIWKSSNRIKLENSSPYWEGGILIKSRHAIHGVTGFSRDIENNPYFEFYFGRIECPYIDELAIEYEIQEKEKITHSSNNPSRIIDPLRSEGLSNDHPFTKALYSEGARRVKSLLKRDEEQAANKIIEIENKKTTERLRKLADEASRFIKERTDISEDIDEDHYLDPSDIPSGGMIIIPGGLKIPIGESRKFYVYIKPTSEQSNRQINISTDSDSILLNSDIEGFLNKGDGIFYTFFSVMGMDYVENSKIKVSWSGVSKDINVSVIKKEEDHPYVEDFSFEKPEYKVREGKIKDILILAKWPDIVHGEVECEIASDNEEFITLAHKKVRMKYAQFSDGTELAIGHVKVFAKKVGGPTIIKAKLLKEVSTRIFVIPPKKLGHDMEIKVVDEDFGDQRAIWIGNLLKIGGRHYTIRRYLGPAPEFKEQDSIHFRLLLAELIADTVARRVMELNSQKNVREFEDLDVTGFYNKHRKYMNEFLARAHKIQIPEDEIKS